jgi:hypothetical protein
MTGRITVKRKRPSGAQTETARRLLAHEGAACTAGSAATTAAGRVYDKLEAHLAPLLGATGVQSLLVRSAKLAQQEFKDLADVSIFEGSTKLRDRLRAQDSAVTTESATALFATFFALLTTFIGERLTTQVLRSAWPMIEETPPTETTK